MVEQNIPIKAFADELGITVQAVYKRIKKEDALKSLLSREQGKTVIDRKAFDFFSKVTSLNQGLNQVEKVEKVENPLENLEEIKETEENEKTEETKKEKRVYTIPGLENVSEELNRLVNMLNDEIDFYREELAQKNKQIEYLSKALDQQQHLNLMDKGDRLNLNSGEVTPKGKRGFFFSNWFKKYN